MSLTPADDAVGNIHWQGHCSGLNLYLASSASGESTCVFFVILHLQQASSKHSAAKADLDPFLAPSRHLGIQHDLHRCCIIPA